MAADPSVIDAFRKAGRTAGASRKVMKALFEAGLVESNLQNLNHGDRDSLGPLQQRPSQGWRNARDPYKGALDFLKQAIPLAGKYGSAGQLAQAVQRSAFPGRYDERSGEATKYLKGAGGGSDATPGQTDTPMVQSAPSQDFASLVLPQRPQLQVSSPAAPSFAASAALPQGYQAPVASDAPAPQQDLTPALEAIDRLRSAAAPAAAGTATTGPAETTAGTSMVKSVGWPTAKKGNLIGAPHQGTHTLGNWQSDNAIDIGVPEGTPMVALQAGTIVKVKHHPQDGGRFAGDQITVRGANGNEYFYAHGIAGVKPGQKVKQGQKLGVTGSANGVAHLHFGQMKGDPRKHTR
jgi:murein DD-endopeptidase MepM/ murein hydrolase activator NlpD